MRFEEGFFKIFKFFDHENRILKLEFYLEDILFIEMDPKIQTSNIDVYSEILH